MKDAPRFLTLIVFLLFFQIAANAEVNSLITNIKVPHVKKEDPNLGLTEKERHIFFNALLERDSLKRFTLSDSLKQIGYNKGHINAIIQAKRAEILYFYYTGQYGALSVYCENFRDYLRNAAIDDYFHWSYFLQAKLAHEQCKNRLLLRVIKSQLTDPSPTHNDLYDVQAQYFLLAHLQYLNHNFIYATQNYLAILKSGDEVISNEFGADVILGIAQCCFALGETESIHLILKKGKDFLETCPIKKAEGDALDALAYAKAGDKERFIKSYNSLRDRKELVSKDNQAFLDINYEFFTTGNCDMAQYEDRLCPPCFYFTDYILAKAKGDKGLALAKLEDYNTLMNEQYPRVSSYELTYMDRASYSVMLHKSADTISWLMVIASIFIIALLISLLLYSLVISRKNRALNKANKTQQNFVKNMSHEFRTPINAISGFAQLLATAGVNLSDEEKDLYLQYIDSNTLLLQMLVEDVLTLNEIETGKVTLKKEPVNINEVCQTAVESIKKQCKEGIEVSYRKTLPDTATIESDRYRILQILLNFLTNSMKNTEKGSIFVECNFDEIPGHVTFSVTDTGCGIPDEMQEIIFDKFIKVDPFKPGTGLGLTICRKITEMLGGNVILDTKYTTGAKFLLILPS